MVWHVNSRSLIQTLFWNKSLQIVLTLGQHLGLEFLSLRSVTKAGLSLSRSVTKWCRIMLREHLTLLIAVLIHAWVINQIFHLTMTWEVESVSGQQVRAVGESYAEVNAIGTCYWAQAGVWVLAACAMECGQVCKCQWQTQWCMGGWIVKKVVTAGATCNSS